MWKLSLDPTQKALIAQLEASNARSGDVARIEGYCGDGDTLDRALADFAEAYGDQTERDHAELVQAIKRGHAKPSANGNGRTDTRPRPLARPRRAAVRATTSVG